MNRFEHCTFRHRVTIQAAVAIAVTLFAPGLFANHPVLVEGNCDSPTPGTTSVAVGTCGDFDGDGRIGGAEDTDGADRVFGTLTAALGPGAGAAAGTGANQNGSLLIVTSGRFPELLTIHGNVTIEAAPGVTADLDAVLQGDPAGGNTTRQNWIGIYVSATTNNRVVLRNLGIRNYAEGIRIIGNSRVLIDNVRVEHNLNYGIRILDSAQVTMFDTKVHATGYRDTCPSACTPAPAHGISVENSSSANILHAAVTGNFGVGISNTSSVAGAVKYMRVVGGHNGGGDFIGATRVNY